jgi:hypothetical protein
MRFPTVFERAPVPLDNPEIQATGRCPGSAFSSWSIHNLCSEKCGCPGYLFATSGTNFPPAATQQQLFARAGYRIFNGDGTGTIITTTSENGVIVLADSLSDLSYAVNKDRTGTYEVLSTGATAEFFVAPNGEEMVVCHR